MRCSTHVPGLCAVHAVVTDDCRRNRGDEGAADEALARADRALRSALRGWDRDRGATFHVVVTVERPED